jgi:N-acetyl-gamma-glutamyl-phosphate reductase
LGYPGGFHDQGWNRRRHRLHRCRTVAPAGATPGSADRRHHLAGGSRHGRLEHVSQPARRLDLKFEDPASANLQSCDVVFFATPNGVAMEQAPALLDAGVRVIDLAADFRIKDVAEWEPLVRDAACQPGVGGKAVYGLPEHDRAAIRNARLVANPGCYPTAVQLGFMPLLEAGLVELDQLVADAKSGVSGAGRKAEVGALFSEAADNFKAYAVPGHRHLPEIQQGLSSMAGSQSG